MDFLYAQFGNPLPLWLPLAFGLAGAFLAIIGSMLRGRFTPAPRRAGAVFCVLGLGLMIVGLWMLGARFGNGSHT